ncbi:MAG: peptidylprolyl isomerase [Candidatus Magasanikbacteria bacterium]
MLRTIIIFLIAGAIVGLMVYSWNFNKSSPSPQNKSAADWEQIQSQQLEKYSQSLTGASIDSSTLKINIPNSPTVSTHSMTIQEKLSTPAPTQAVIDINKIYGAILHTSMGDIQIALNAQNTPNTVNNFVYLSKLGFYNDTIFHRVIKGFMIQGGDPKGDGTGGPNYRFADEKFTGEYDAGTVAMANAGPNTNGSQFFIMHQKYNLPKNYTIFGKVVRGMEVVDKIATAEVEMSASGEDSQPVNPVEIKSVDIVEQ